MDDGPLSVGHCRDFYMRLPETTTIVGVGWGRFSVACCKMLNTFGLFGRATHYNRIGGDVVEPTRFFW